VSRRPVSGKEGGTSGNDAQEIAALHAELRTAQNNLAIERNLREAAEDQAERLSDDNKRLREEIERLKGPSDPWQPCVEKFLGDRPDVYRHPSLIILRDALDIPERNHDSEVFRRLARVMRRIGGWRGSPNIPYRDGRVRGWRKPRYG
jgi:hypothetical protein